MTWRDDLRRVTLPNGRRLIGASFRGVPFLVTASDRSGGRRIDVKQFPLRNDPAIEDLGRHARVFRLDGYVLGDDYVAQRDALLVALEDTSGPGELVHPYQGVKRVVCSGLSLRESVSDGGLAIFSLEFTEAPTAPAAPVEEVDHAAKVSAGADAAVAAAQAALVAAYDVTGLPPHALVSAAAALKAVAARLGEELAPAIRDAQELAALNGQVHLLEAEAASLARQPAAALEAVLSSISSLAATAASAPEALMRALIAAYSVELPALAPATTVTRRRERANQTALYGALRQVLAIEAGRLAPTVAFGTLEDAAAARDAIAAELEAEAGVAGDDMFPSLVQLRADLVRAIPGPAVLARLVMVERPVAVPSILLAFQLYGSTAGERDLVARNRSRHPAFMAGSLQALSGV